MASQVNVVQKPQRQRAHSDAGGQNEVKEVDELGADATLQAGECGNRRLAGALPETVVGITQTIRNSRNGNKKIRSRERS